ncbi:MAG: hypothetical protein COB79_05350 [Zetaproteobacteria bacterium]|nr:MAG: hypothetical protein COB79_05350 [Zetaproteobacteria bacterium]
MVTSAATYNECIKDCELENIFTDKVYGEVFSRATPTKNAELQISLEPVAKRTSEISVEVILEGKLDAYLKSLEALTLSFEEDQNQHQLVNALSVLLRRICLSYYPRKDVAGLSGDAWLRFLDTHLGKSKQSAPFSRGPGRILVTAPYQALIEIDGQALLSLCKNWIKTLPPKGRKL